MTFSSMVYSFYMYTAKSPPIKYFQGDSVQTYVMVLYLQDKTCLHQTATGKCNPVQSLPFIVSIISFGSSSGFVLVNDWFSFPNCIGNDTHWKDRLIQQIFPINFRLLAFCISECILKPSYQILIQSSQTCLTWSDFNLTVKFLDSY